jgi:hypothetical protein
MAGIIKVDQLQSDSNLAFNIAGSNVAFLDSSSMRMVSSNLSLAGTTVISNSRVTANTMPVGSILQVVQTRTMTSESTSATGFVNISGLATTVTPVKSNSKFLLQMDLTIGAYTWFTNGFYIGCNVNWTGGSLATVMGDGGGQWIFQYGADSTNSAYETLQINDSVIIQPNTSNTLTINPTFATLNSSYAVFLNRSYGNYYGDQGSSRLTVMEIAQ